MTPLAFYALNGSLAGTDASGNPLSAVGAGALRYRSGPWAGSQSAFVEAGTTNAVLNPVIANDTNNFLNVRTAMVRDTSKSLGGYTTAAKFTVNDTSSGNQGCNFITASQAAATYIGQAIIYHELGSPRDFWIADYSAMRATVPSGVPTLVVSSAVSRGAGNTYMEVRCANAQMGDVWWVTCGQFEQKAYATSFCEGGKGPGFSWTATANASASTRAATTLTLPYSGTLGSLAAKYSEDGGATWQMLYRAAPVAGAIGTYGAIADDGSKLTFSSSRALLIGPAYLAPDVLTPAQQATLSGATSPWTAGILMPNLGGLISIPGATVLTIGSGHGVGPLTIGSEP